MSAWKAIALGACGSATLFSLNPTQAQAAPLVTYPLTNGLNYSSLNSSILSASSLTKRTLTRFTIANGEPCCGPDYLLLTSPGSSIAGATATTAFSGNWYFTISLTPTTFMNIDSVTLQWARGGTSATRGWFLRSSRDNYTANLFSVSTANGADTNLRPVNVNLTGFTNISSNTDFRFYIYTPSSGQSVDFSAITFSGSGGPEAAQVPAPLPIAGLFAAFRTSRHLRRRLRNQAG